MPKLIEKEQDFWHLMSSVAFITLAILLIYFAKISGRLIYEIPAFDLVILALATFRMIRLFTYDNVTDYIRNYLSGFEKGPRKTLSSLLDCPWCTGVWMSLVSMTLYLLVPYSWTFLLILAIAGAASFIQITIWKIGLEK